MTTDTPSSKRRRKWTRDELEQMLQRAIPQLERFAARRFPMHLLRRESPRDIVQAACLEVLHGFATFDDHGAGEAAFRRWVFRSVLRKLQDLRKFHMRECRSMDREIVPATDLTPITDTPSRKVIARETRDSVQRALATLPPQYLEVLRLVQLEGLSAAEAGQRLGISTVATRSLVARAIRQFGIAYQRMNGGPTTTYVVRRRRP